MSAFDVVVVGAGPNGLAAAAHLTRAGKRVLVLEQADRIGGGTRTEELTLPGFLHDVCSAIHPLGAASRSFRDLGLDIEWIHPLVPVSHPLGGGRPAGMLRGLDETALGFGEDGGRYRRLLAPLVANADAALEDLLAPLRPVPRHPGAFGRLALLGALPASTLIGWFDGDEARAALAGMAAHAIAPLTSPLTAGAALLFSLAAHAYGWPMVKGGSQRIAEALAGVVLDGGGSIETGHRVTTLDGFADGTVFLLDVMPEAALTIAGGRAWPRLRRRAEKHRVGPAVFKLDWALGGPIPWADELSPLAGTVHVGGRFEEVMAAEEAVHRGSHPERPFVLLAQHTPFDPSRAPDGMHTAWGYCHVPAGSDRDMTEAMEAQVERFAPGFRDLILARHALDGAGMEQHNPNNIGGDIAGGAFSLRRVVRMGASRSYRVGDRVFLCSSATPPGAGVHGMCGYHAARAALAAMDG